MNPMIGPFTLNEILIAILWAETVWLAWLFGSIREVRRHNRWLEEHIRWLDSIAVEPEAPPLSDILSNPPDMNSSQAAYAPDPESIRLMNELQARYINQSLTAEQLAELNKSQAALYTTPQKSGQAAA